MKKETQIHAIVEIIDILPNFTFTGGTIEEVREQAKQALKAKFEGLAVDHCNITDVKIVEIEKEISTEDLIKATRDCIKISDCKKCLLCSDGRCNGRKMLADRLEELHKQLTATQAEHTCDNCRYDMKGLPACIDCIRFDNWQRKRG